MVFSSPIFLFFFLPLVLFLTYLFRGVSFKNIVLLISSLVFYSWGEPDLVLLMIVMILVNYLIGLKLESRNTNTKRKTFLILGLVLNIAAIGYFKYANFIVDNLNFLLFKLNSDGISNNPVRLPIGISFYTFQCISYLVDVYRKDVEVQKNPFSLGLYISLFPQLIAGPIVRYHDIHNQIKSRKVDLTLFHSGVKRFIEGLAKKVVIANTVGYQADQIFSLSPENVSSGALILGAVLYTIQIYFDFSGYSDMAIGIGRMFGFRLLENFNFPYIATSIRDFWRRWHISLSTWFRDYVYIPMGGNRGSSSRTYFNLVVVFLVTGLWHGASWNFVLWGIFHGLLLIIERIGGDKLLLKMPRPARHLYTILMVVFGWILFRVDNLEHFIQYVKSIFIQSDQVIYSFNNFFNTEIMIALLFGLTFSMPIKVFNSDYRTYPYKIIEICLYLLILLLSILLLSVNTYNPFIYFQF